MVELENIEKHQTFTNSSLTRFTLLQYLVPHLSIDTLIPILSQDLQDGSRGVHAKVLSYRALVHFLGEYRSVVVLIEDFNVNLWTGFLKSKSI